MRTIEVRRTLAAPPERVFDVLSDHAGYVRFPGVRAAELLREGSPDKNGVGALRRVEVGLAWFEEEITAFERPTTFAYRIVRSRFPIEHVGGRLTFVAQGEGTEVVWTTTLRVAVPIVGGALTAVAARELARGFSEVLRVTEHLAR